MILIDHFTPFVNSATVFKIDTRNLSTGSTDNKTMRIEANGNFYGTVVWGDGNSDTYSSAIGISLTHVYAVSGIYTITIVMSAGNGFKLFVNNNFDKDKLIEFVNYGSDFILGSSAFYGALNFDLRNTNGVIKKTDTSFQNAFRGYPFATVKNIEKTDVSGVLTMTNMFSNATLFSQDLSQWTFNKNVILQNFMSGKSAANYSAANYSALIIKVCSCVVGTGRTQTNKNWGMGSIKRDSSSNTAYALMVADGWVFTDGGLI